MKRVAFYTRVSTVNQTTDNQILELEKVASRMGYEIVLRLSDSGISGAKGKDQRPAFKALCDAATRREIDMVMAWSVDRLSRSLQDLVTFMSELHAVGCDLYLHQQAIDTSTPSGKALFQMCGVFAEFERGMIRERIVSGLDRAKSQGKIFGRPKVSKQVEFGIKNLLTEGSHGIKKIAKTMNVGVSVVQRIKGEMNA